MLPHWPMTTVTTVNKAQAKTMLLMFIMVGEAGLLDSGNSGDRKRPSKQFFHDF